MARFDGGTGRIINIVLGVWLFISAFIWPHTYAQMTNTWIVGLLIAIVAALAMRAPQLRYLNTALAVWLFVSVWALPTLMAATFWNNLIVALLVFFISLMPGGVVRRPGMPRPARTA